MSTKENKMNAIDSENQCSQEIDESFRIDDNSDYSPTALEENKCLDDLMIPGTGVSDKEPEDEQT